MKNAKKELFSRMQRQYHRHHSWDLVKGGLYIPHSYPETKLDSLSTWDEVGFILNGRRVWVEWKHPRYVYENEIEEQAWKEAGDEPPEGCQPTAEHKLYRRRFRINYERLVYEGIDLDVLPSFKREQLTWATGVSLVAPLEVRNESELASVALLARRLILGQTTLEAEFPGYRYGRANWLRDRE